MMLRCRRPSTGLPLPFVMDAQVDQKGVLHLLIHDNGRTYRRKFSKKHGAVVNMYMPSYSSMFVSAGIKPTAPRGIAGWRTQYYRHTQSFEVNQREAALIVQALLGEELDLRGGPWQNLPLEGVRSFTLSRAA